MVYLTHSRAPVRCVQLPLGQPGTSGQPGFLHLSQAQAWGLLKPSPPETGIVLPAEGPPAPHTVPALDKALRNGPFTAYLFKVTLYLAKGGFTV